MQRRYLLAISLIFPLLSLCQKRGNRIVGEKIPDIEITNIVNYERSAVKLSDYKGKLLILDFWATWCGPCISSFPKNDSLLAKFSDKIEILPVSTENKEVVTSFLSKLKSVKNIKTHSVTEDQALSRLFPHVYLPHYVWINKQGIVIGMTGSMEVNEDNIKKVLEGNTLSLPVKIDDQITVVSDPAGDYTLFGPSIMVKDDSSQSLKNIPIKSLLYNSVLTKFVKGLPSGGNFSIDGTQLVVNNMSIRNLYRTAFSGNKLSGLNMNSLIVEIPDSSLYDKITTYRRDSPAEFQVWLEENAYCYSIRVPLQLVHKKEEIMLSELNTYFGSMYGIRGTKERRKVKVLALTKLSKEVKVLTKGGIPSSHSDKFSLTLVNLPISDLISSLTLPLQKYPLLIDQTEITGNIDINFNCQLSNLSGLNKELRKYNLVLIEKVDVVNVGVLKRIAK